MRVTINGEARETEPVKNIAELVAALGWPAPAILVEHNGVALRRDEWSERAMAEGDVLEIIRIVAGG
jgi:sulfur carrier protein